MGIFKSILGKIGLAEDHVAIPPRMRKAQLSTYVIGARRIADIARQKLLKHGAADASGGNLCKGDAFRDPSCHAENEILRALNPADLSYETTEPPVQRKPPNLHAPVLSFSARLLTYVNEKCGGDAPTAYKRAGVSRQVYSRIISDNDSLVDKRTAMRFCIGLQLSIDEAQLLMKSAGYAFSDTITDDVVFSYCIEHKIWNLKDVNEVLLKSGVDRIAPLRNPYR